MRRWDEGASHVPLLVGLSAWALLPVSILLPLYLRSIGKEGGGRARLSQGCVTWESKTRSHDDSRRDRGLNSGSPRSNVKGVSSRMEMVSMGIIFLSYLTAKRC